MLIKLNDYRRMYLPSITQATARAWCEDGLIQARKVRGRWYVETEQRPQVSEGADGFEKYFEAHWPYINGMVECACFLVLRGYVRIIPIIETRTGR